MKKPPKKREIQKDYVQSAVRFPPALRAELQEAAAKNDRSFNAEVLARIQSSDVALIMAELAALRAMLQQLIER